MFRTFFVGCAVLMGGPAVAGELWLSVDVDVTAEEKKVHVEIPYGWMEVLNLEDQGLEKDALAKVAKGLKEGDTRQLVDAKQGTDHVRVALSHRPDGTGPVGKTFFVTSSSGENTMEVPLALLVQMAPMAAALSGETGAVDIAKCISRLDQMRPFTLLTVKSPVENVEIGVR